jgi:hypothetical protein
MTKLVDTKSVDTRGALSDSTDVHLSTAVALESASLYAESVLDTTFARETRTDSFWVSSVEAPFHGEFIFLRLSKAFVDSAQTITVEYSSTWKDFDTDKTALLPSEFVIDAGKGILKILGASLDNIYIKVTYTAGFNVDVVITDVYNQSEVPAWLRDVAVVYSLILMGQSITISPSEPKNSISEQQLSHVGILLAPHTRNGLGLLPII